MERRRSLRSCSAKETLDYSSPAEDMMEDDSTSNQVSEDRSPRKKKRKSSVKKAKKVDESKSSVSEKKKKVERVVVEDSDCRFVGEPIPIEEAKNRWPERYNPEMVKKISGSSKNNDDEEDEILFAKNHYLQAEVDGFTYNLYDDAFVKGTDGDADYIGRIVEFFETADSNSYFTAQWFYRAEDTVIKDHAHLIDKRRLFFSEMKNDNPLDCIVSKLQIVKVSPNVDLVKKETTIPPCDFYYDMLYSLPYTTFSNFPAESMIAASDTSSTISTVAGSDGVAGETKSDSEESCLGNRSPKPEMALLDLYSGCGAMSTGLCLGAVVSGVNLVTRWAVDINEYACQSLKLNHPETEVRNESADNFLSLLREWEKLCKMYSLVGTKDSRVCIKDDAEDDEDDNKVPSGEFEVGKLVGICYGDPNKNAKTGLHFKVRWKGYGPSDDTWEPISGLNKCRERIQDFVTRGYNSNLLPLPGDVDVICGGPPCQGISGFNRFRNKAAPLEDPKNQQMVVFMDIVDYLKPKYVLMENVVDLLKFSKGFLARYAFGRIVSMNYQARLGMMAAGCYGLPQFRMRVFLWGAQPSEKLPPYPLPTHEVVVRGVVPTEFEQSTVAYDENHGRELENALLLGDAISDLPPVANDESRDEMPYGIDAQTEFQKYIRLSKHDLLPTMDPVQKTSQKLILFDHRPLQLNDDDYGRVCHVPKKKGANFRDFPGVFVRPDKKVEWDESIPRVKLPSGKPLVPDYAMSFMDGTSSKPFGRLWWDETVPTVVTRAEPHNQVITHPEQDRVLSIRENARLQGFPDYYKLIGPVKERYIQVGNAVAVPVARALGYALGLASQGIITDQQPLMTLPPKFSFSVGHISSTAVDADTAILDSN